MATGPPRPRHRFLPADLRLSRAHRRGRQISRRLSQARRPPDDQGNAHRAAHGSARSGRCFPTWFHDEVQIQSFVLASDRQNDGDVLAMIGAARRPGHLAAAVPGPDRLGPAGPHRRPVRAVPHARRAGRERSRPDRLGQQGRGADDRGLCPRNARRPHARGDRRSAIASSSEHLRPAGRAVRQGQRRKRSSTRLPPPTACSTSSRSSYYDALQAGQADRRASTPGPTPCRQLKERVLAELIPDPAAEGGDLPDALQPCLARARRARRPRSDPRRHAARRPRQQDSCGPSTARSTCCRACTARPCSSAAKRRP